MSYIKQHYHDKLTDNEDHAMAASHLDVDMLTEEEYNAPGPEVKTLSKEKAEEYFKDQSKYDIQF